MPKSPKVSVLTPVYNTNPVHLREMIESILNQTFTDFEFLILNDSPDNAEIEKIILEYADADKRIVYLKNDKNMGITPSRNKLLKKARGEYLAIFDHDDISVPTRLEKEVAYLDSNPWVGVVSGWLQYFGTESTIMSTPEHDMDIKINLTNKCSIAHTAAMIRKSVLTDNNIEYEEYYTPAEDYRLWARLIDLTHFYNLQEVLVKYRWLRNNTTTKQWGAMSAAHDSITTELINKHPGYHMEYIKRVKGETLFRLRLFNVIPIIKIKNNTIYLFEFIPLFTLKWR